MVTRYEDCAECEGEGGWIEGSDDTPQDQAWVKCHECDGDGSLPVDLVAEAQDMDAADAE